MFNQPCNSIIIEIIKEIDIDKNKIKIQKSSVESSMLSAYQFLFLEYEQKSSTQSKIIIKNIENENINICVHKGYGVYPYLIKPICESNEYINLKKNEELILTYDNPYLSPISQNINNIDNPLYISLYANDTIKYSYVYEKYSNFNMSNGYKDINFNGKEIIQLEKRRVLPTIYYQIYLCQDFNNNIQEYPFNKPLFIYYFDKKENIEINNVNKNIFKEYELHTDNPIIVFNTDGTLKGKFKYEYGDKNKFKYFNYNYSKKINTSQNKNILKISVESPFPGNITIVVIIITSDFSKYNGYCEVIDFYEYLKKNVDTIYYGMRFIQKNIYLEEGNSTAEIEIESEKILDLNRKNAKVFVINNFKEVDFDVFYDPVSIYINLRDYETELEERNNNFKIIFIIIFCVAIVCIVFIAYRSCQKKRAHKIDYEVKKIQLTDESINESNKLF
jgi:hypothetical protein